MKIKYLLAIVVSTLTMTTFADNLTQSFPDGTNLMNVENSANLDAKFVSSKRMYKITDAKSVVKMFNLNLVVNGQSNIDKSNGGVMIVSTGTVRDYLNILGDQFGYCWSLNGSNVIFNPINPVMPKPTPLPIQKTTVAPVPVVISTPIVKQSESKQVESDINIVVINNSTTNNVTPTPVSPLIKTNQQVVESKPIVKTPTTPLITSTNVVQNKNYGVWEMKISDKTVKKTFQRWAKDAGWQLIWNANVDYPISAGMSIEGDFDYAVNEVCRASQYTDNKIIGEFHPKNKVIVITTQD